MNSDTISAAREIPLQVEIGRLKNEFVRLNKLVETLQQRLNPFVMDSVPASQTDKKPERLEVNPTSSFVKGLIELKTDLRVTNDKLEDIIHRLEI